MNPDDLKVFLHVAKTGSISRTAMELGANQSTISRRVGLLETELGVRLLVERRAERHGFTLHIVFEYDGSISLTQRLVMERCGCTVPPSAAVLEDVAAWRRRMSPECAAGICGIGARLLTGASRIDA
ncbi:LysR family transcriptional regulator [Burkholderia plantarii]|nr:LysR family transcriptional regulator [Burkholderia plantarii]